MISPDHVQTLNNVAELIKELGFMQAIAGAAQQEFAYEILGNTVTSLGSLVARAVARDLNIDLSVDGGRMLTPDEFDEAGLYMLAKELRENPLPSD